MAIQTTTEANAQRAIMYATQAKIAAAIRGPMRERTQARLDAIAELIPLERQEWAIKKLSDERRELLRQLSEMDGI